MRTLFILSAFLLSSMSAVAQHHHGDSATLKAEKVSEHSMYHLKAEWITHRNESVTLSQFKGEPVIVVMFYGNCTQVCPILIRDTWRLYNSIDESLRSSVNVLAVSFDRENDSPEVLKKYAEYEQLNIEGWHFVTAKEADIRSLAMMLGVQYVKKSDGEFAHSNLVSVLDTEGKVAVRVEGLNQPMVSAARKVEDMLKHHTMQ
ncbi:SCO family protein [Gracilimonas sediminicola]|uniref:SCO family protein n=1 Tax=Gracilimonas sediminicola TaxID=2952158 RepID=A0A9X2REA7_9BACT|nr:SCO family protein [Gracilimonas sediminicola]MCP9290113.1 SCO family protein [Gracilimonas sediminicola]